MSVDEVSSKVGEFLVAEMEVPATWSEGFSSSKAGDDCPFILPNFSRLPPCCQRRASSLERPKPSFPAAPGLSTVAAPNPTRAGNYRVRRA